MKKTFLTFAITMTAGIISFAGNAKAQTITNTFGTGSNQFTLTFQTIGHTNNAADNITTPGTTNKYGAVNYQYDISTYSISQNQINLAKSNGLLGVTGGAWSNNQPAANVTWLQAAAFVNFLDTNSGFHAAYNLTYSGGAYAQALWTNGQLGYNSSNPFRNSLAVYVLPTENEWFKAAYYNPSANGGSGGYNLYSTGNTAPTKVASGTNANTAVYGTNKPASVSLAGGTSAYGTVGQSGNINDFLESAFSGTNTNVSANRVYRGGGYSDVTNNLAATFRQQAATNYSGGSVGFDVVELAVPEPSIYALFGLSALVLVIAYRRKVS